MNRRLRETNLLIKKLIPALQLGVAVMLLAGCASQSIIMPSAASLADDGVAILKIDRTIKSSLAPELNGIVDLGTNKIVLRSEGFKDYYKIKIAPGEYNVMLKVYSSGYAPAFPSVRIKAKPGMTYLFASSTVMNGKAVSAEYKEIPTTADTTPDK